MNNIQWYPGHMTKTRRMMEENISLVDIVIELVDARIPYSSKNPDLDTLAKNKHRILLLNKCDLADERATDIWQEYFEKQGFRVIRINALKGNGLGEVTETARSLMKEKIEKLKARGRINVPIRSMIVGIPNVGKSTFINKVSKRKTARAEDRPGVTRSKQWVPVDSGLQLLDTPGILWPKFEDPEVGMMLAYTGAVKEGVIDLEELAYRLMELLHKFYPQTLLERYKVEAPEGTPGRQLLEMAGKEENIDYINKNNEALLSEYSRVIDGLEEIFGCSNEETTADLKETDAAELRRICDEFEDIVYSFDPDQMMQVINELKQYSCNGIALADKLVQIEKKIVNSDYMSAADALKRIIDEITTEGDDHAL